MSDTSELQRFLPKDQELLSGILYRIGYWISHVDDTDEGDRSEQVEHQHLLGCLNKISKAPKAGALLNEMAEESCRQEQSWPRWETKNDSILDDVAAAVSLLKSQGTEDEEKSFAKASMMVGMTVARAFREEPEHAVEHEGYFSWLTEKANDMILAVTDKDAHKDLGVSPEEDNALNDLLAILKS